MTVLKVKEYAKNHTLQEIAEHFGKSKSQMCSFMKHFEINYIKQHPTGRPSQKSPIADDLIRDYIKGGTLKELAFKYGKSKEGIRFILIREGVYQGVRKGRVSIDEVKQALSGKDTRNMTLDECYFYCINMCKKSSFNALLNRAGIPFKHKKRGRKS